MKKMDLLLHWTVNLLLFGGFAALIFGCAGFVSGRAEAWDGAYRPGVYEGTGQGYRGPVHVRLQVSQAGILDISITGHVESVYPGEAAMEELSELVLETGSTDLDAVSGATFSSRGFLEAVEDALEKAASKKTQNGGGAGLKKM